MSDDPYEVGYRDGESNREADIRIAVTHSRTPEELIQRLRDMTGCQDMNLGDEWEGGAESASIEGRLRAIRQRAREVLERSERSVRPFDPSLPPEGQGLPAGASRRCECRRPATKIVEYRDDGIVMFWGVVCDEHAQADRDVSISIA